MALDPDWSIRLAAFNELRTLVKQHGEVLPWSVIEKGFPCGGVRLLFANRARGIFWPSSMKAGALSIKTTVPREGRTARYDDENVAADGALLYAFQGTSSDACDNTRLLRTRALNAPLIYFYGVAPGMYRPLWPVYVDDADITARLFHIVAAAADQPLHEPGSFAADPKSLQIERRYATVEVKKRLHQAAFRQHVLRAYAERCAVCRFPRPEMLDAAHIVPDRDVRGHAEVPNGVSLCRLHHGAFDADLIGFRPDGIIEMSRRLLRNE